MKGRCQGIAVGNETKLMSTLQFEAEDVWERRHAGVLGGTRPDFRRSGRFGCEVTKSEA